MKGHISLRKNLWAARRGIPLRLGDWFAVPADLMFVGFNVGFEGNVHFEVLFHCLGLKIQIFC